ncbi:MAG TPA: hypothetical protein VNF91_02800, partial [Candidatus Acidoferrum sp.]|nr:hypothetical protein [Candidatus Acidoferrum sp.]
MVLFTVLLLAVAAVAGVAVRTIGEQGARQSARADTSFAAQAAAAQIAGGLLLLERSASQLASNPKVVAILGATPGACTLQFAAGAPFSAGHLDLIKPDGSVVCSSTAVATGAVYGTAGWLPAAIVAPLTAAPYLDPVTGLMSAVVAAPVAGGAGAVIAIVELGPLGPDLAATLGGPSQLEFLVTTDNDQIVLARSLQPLRWVGKPLAGT